MTDVDLTEEELKELLEEVFVEGYTIGYGVEEMHPVGKRAAKTKFERLWERNFEE